MTFHAFREYLKYRWKAKGRHGTHSPFAYDFVEKVLRDKRPVENNMAVLGSSGLPDQMVSLLAGIVGHLDLKEIRLSDRKDIRENCPDALMLPQDEPNEWVSAARAYFPIVKNETVIIVLGIHKTAQHTNAWNMLCDQNEIRVSIDLHKVGLLFFRKEFKEKQHFVLR